MSSMNREKIDYRFKLNNYLKNIIRKKKYESEYNVIIIGGCHHNMLGVIRALGENEIYSNIIVTNEDKNVFIKKSKYVNKYDIIDEDENKILELLNKYNDKKYILIPTSDFAALVLDKNYNMLKKKFILPSINEKQGEIIKLMDKSYQHSLANKYNILQAKSMVVNLSKDEAVIISNKFKYPCILKPVVSAYGSKNDIRICYSKKELIESFNYLKKLKYKNILLQEYIKFDKEYGIIGCINDGHVIVPGMIEKLRIYPTNRGNVSYGKIKKYNHNPDIEKILSLIKKINYSGLFDIEVFHLNGRFYLNEINFRNSGNSYVYRYNNIFIVYLWILMINGKNINFENKTIYKEYFFEDERLELKQLFCKNISFKQWFKALYNSKIYFILNKNDIKPVVYKLFYAIINKFKK